MPAYLDNDRGVHGHVERVGGGVGPSDERLYVIASICCS